MTIRKLAGVTGFTAAALALALVTLAAQAPSIERIVLQRGDLAAPGREGVMAKGIFPAGGTTGRHTHPGEEITYVLEGTIVLEVEGAPTRTLKAGDFFMVPAEKVHNATSQGAATVVATYVVEKGKPLTTPVK